MVTAIILNYNDAQTTINLHDHIKGFRCIERIVVIDNHSTDASLRTLEESIKSSKTMIVESEKNGGYGYGNNIGIRIAKEQFQSDYILICNPDVIFDEATVETLIDAMETHPSYAVLAPLMHAPNGERMDCFWMIPNAWEYLLCHLYFAGKRIRNKKQQCTDDYVCRTECVAGSLLFCRTDPIFSYAMYDENIFLFCEETVQGIKLKRADLDVGVLPSVSFIHNHSVSIKKSIPRDIQRNKILWSSKLYVMKEYYGFGGIRMLCAKLICRISVCERVLLTFFSGLLHK